MKRYIKPISILPLAVMLCAATFAAPPRADGDVLHIKGSIKATEDHTVTPPTMTVQLEGTGHATHLGLYVLTAEETVTMPALASHGTFEIDAEGGAMLSGTVAGQGTLINGGSEAVIDEVYTITTGAGRFHGATGTITVNRVVDRTTLNSSGTIEGTLTLPDHGRCR
ncbi:MAG TPA: hypothetical protein VLW52_08840 [Opitutaceae bacterium]|nr:hypothetical protein [Opitutaceae bacterium]